MNASYFTLCGTNVAPHLKSLLIYHVAFTNVIKKNTHTHTRMMS
jgi:hypothetical protein